LLRRVHEVDPMVCTNRGCEIRIIIVMLEQKEIPIPESRTHLLHPGFQGSCGPLGSVSDLSVTPDRMGFVSCDCLEIPNFREVAHRSSPQKKIGVHH